MTICIRTIIRAEEESVGVDLSEEEAEGVVVIAIAVNRQIVTATHTAIAHIPEDNVIHQVKIIKLMLPSQT